MAETQNFNYFVEMSCGGCSGAVDRILKKLKSTDEGLAEYNINLTQKQVTVKSTPELEPTVFQKLNNAKKTERADKEWNKLDGDAPAQGYESAASEEADVKTDDAVPEEPKVEETKVEETKA